MKYREQFLDLGKTLYNKVHECVDKNVGREAIYCYEAYLKLGDGRYITCVLDGPETGYVSIGTSKQKLDDYGDVEYYHSEGVNVHFHNYFGFFIYAHSRDYDGENTNTKSIVVCDKQKENNKGITIEISDEDYKILLDYLKKVVDELPTIKYDKEKTRKEYEDKYGLFDEKSL